MCLHACLPVCACVKESVCLKERERKGRREGGCFRAKPARDFFSFCDECELQKESTETKNDIDSFNVLQYSFFQMSCLSLQMGVNCMTAHLKRRDPARHWTGHYCLVVYVPCECMCMCSRVYVCDRERVGLISFLRTRDSLVEMCKEETS